MRGDWDVRLATSLYVGRGRSLSQGLGARAAVRGCFDSQPTFPVRKIPHRCRMAFANHAELLAARLMPRWR